jgi:hypothetical protein
MDENLAENLSFVLDAILDDVDEPYAETLEAALTLAQFSWNNTVQENHTKIDACITQLDKLQSRNPRLWEQLIRHDAPSLIQILMQRKAVFYPDDNRIIKECFFNMLGTITVTEGNHEETCHVQSRL